MNCKILLSICVYAAASAIYSLAEAGPQLACRPVLAIKNVRYSEMQPPSLERKWSANVTVDASRCATSAKGKFEIGFSRMKENATEIIFYEQFSWSPPAVDVETIFAADEAVEQAWLGEISPCSCSN